MKMNKDDELAKAKQSAIQLSAELGRVSAEKEMLREEHDLLFQDWRHMIDRNLEFLKRREVPMDLRVSFVEAQRGVKNVAPGVDLPSCPDRTLRRWLRDKASLLGVFEPGRKKSAPTMLRPLVRGLLILHVNPKRGTKPPQARKTSVGN